MINYTRALYLINLVYIIISSFVFYQLYECMSVWFLEISHINMNTIIASDVHNRKKTQFEHFFLHNWDLPSSFDRGGIWFAESQYKLIQQVWWYFGLHNFLSSKIVILKILIFLNINIVNALNIFFKVLVLVTLIFKMIPIDK